MMDVQEFLQRGEAWGAGLCVDGGVFLRRLRLRSINKYTAHISECMKVVTYEGVVELLNVERLVRRSSIRWEVEHCVRCREKAIATLERALEQAGGGGQQYKLVEVLKNEREGGI